MSKLIITAGSVTTAMRIKKQLDENSKFSSTLIHTPAAINRGGCSYSVKTDYDNINLVRTLASKNKIKYKALYLPTELNGELVYNDIS